MAARRLEEMIDGRLRPVCTAPPLLLSSDFAWAGFILERDLCREGGAQTIVYPHTSLVLVDSGSIEVEDRALRRDRRRFVARCGSVTLWPAGYEARDIAWRPAPPASAGAEMIRVQLDLSALDRLTPDDDRLVRRPLDQQPGIDDAALASMMRLMAAEVAARCPAGRLFAESLCLALAVHVAQRYAGGPPQPRVLGGLSQRQLERVRDHIESRLDGDLSLVELAGVAGLSPRHFASAFRKSVGVTPHQHVLRRRIDEAKTLLAVRRMPIAEVAATLGFSSQSHFTEVFHRMVGSTPTRFRQDR